MHIVADIGGTNMRIAAASTDSLGEIKKLPTPKSPKEAMAEFVRLARELVGERQITDVVCGIRWFVVDGIFLSGDGPLEAWGGLHLRKELSRALNAPVTIIHDTAAVGLGEVYAGAGRGSKICAYITVSTGVGGDRIVDGHIDRSTYHPEIGRQLVNGERLEDIVSGSAVQRKFGIHPKELDSLDERNKLADTLAIGLYNTVMHWSPDTIVLGGSMIVGVNPIPIPRIQESLNKLLTIYPKPPVIKMAELGDNGGLWGGLALLKQAE
ncbi:MAG: ROK family protein [bacterium]|nr:ROK family protein [bacterium]